MEGCAIKLVHDQCLESPAGDGPVRDPDSPVRDIVQVEESTAEQDLEDATEGCDDQGDGLIGREHGDPVSDADGSKGVQDQEQAEDEELADSWIEADEPIRDDREEEIEKQLTWKIGEEFGEQITRNTINIGVPFVVEYRSLTRDIGDHSLDCCEDQSNDEEDDTTFATAQSLLVIS